MIIRVSWQSLEKIHCSIFEYFSDEVAFQAHWNQW